MSGGILSESTYSCKSYNIKLNQTITHSNCVKSSFKYRDLFTPTSLLK